MDADPATVVGVLKEMKAAGKAVVGMKILGQGELRTRQDEAIKYALSLGLLDAALYDWRREQSGAGRFDSSDRGRVSRVGLRNLAPAVHCMARFARLISEALCVSRSSHSCYVSRCQRTLLQLVQRTHLSATPMKFTSAGLLAGAILRSRKACSRRRKLRKIDAYLQKVGDSTLGTCATQDSVSLPLRSRSRLLQERVRFAWRRNLRRRRHSRHDGYGGDQLAIVLGHEMETY